MENCCHGTGNVLTNSWQVFWFIIFLQFFTSAMAKVRFSSLSVALSVCLSVRPSVRPSICLSVSNITGKRLNGFSWIFQGRWDLIQGTIGNIFKMFHSTPWTQEFFPTFFEESMTLSSIAEKGLTGFSWNFQKGTDLTQEAIWKTFGMLRSTPWNLDRFTYFLDPCL